MPLTKVLIVVKTYPAISSKYNELVCTAGFREDGTWVRLYPILFRQKSYDQQYRKYDWIEVDLVKNTSDFRPESYRPLAHDTEIRVVGHINTDANWEERKGICMRKIYHNLSELIAEAKDTNICTSLAVFKPTEILDFTAESVTAEWSKTKLEKLKQSNLFESVENGRFNVVQKLPYTFRYVLKDNQGRVSKMMIEDWETGQLYWKCLARHNGDEQKAIEDVRKKYLDDFARSKDLHLFLGTSLLRHHTSRNPFMIIGTFHPKIDLQTRLF